MPYNATETSVKYEIIFAEGHAFEPFEVYQRQLVTSIHASLGTNALRKDPYTNRTS